MSKKTEGGDRYVRLFHYMLKTSAWLNLSAGARALYVQLAFRYNGSNNGRITCSVRDAATECRLNKDTAARAFKELADAGFIHETRHGELKKTKMASEWRLTAYNCDGAPSREFLTRGALGIERRLHRSRPQNACPKIGTHLSETRGHI